MDYLASIGTHRGKRVLAARCRVSFTAPLLLLRRKGCVVLTPVDEAYALRPSLEHLAKEPEAKAVLQSVDSREEDEKGTELQPLTVRPLPVPRGGHLIP